MLIFDEYRQNAPEESDRWATSNRGWAFDGEDATTSFAHYLDYAGTSERGQQGKRIHVVIVGRGVVWVRSCKDARLAITKAYKRYLRHVRWHDRQMGKFANRDLAESVASPATGREGER